MSTKKEMWPVMLTPFTERGEVDYNGLEKLIEFYEAGGSDGLFATCQSSEIFYLSLEERIKIASFVKKHAHIPVIASGHVSYSREDQAEEAAPRGGHRRGRGNPDYQPPGGREGKRRRLDG